MSINMFKSIRNALNEILIFTNASLFNIPFCLGEV